MSVSLPCANGADRIDPTRSTVRAAMVTRPKTCDTATTVGQARAMFRDDHVHSLLLVRERRLVAVVERADLCGAVNEVLAARFGSLHDRIVAPDIALETVLSVMINRSRRRLAVVDRDRVLLGLLCLKRSLHGFCSDDDVASRAQSGSWPQRAVC